VFHQDVLRYASALRGKKELVAATAEKLADQFLGPAVVWRGVDVVDPRIEQSIDDQVAERRTAAPGTTSSRSW
jgi:hypothetical protein